MLFTGVRRKYDLTERQMYYLRQRLEKYHKKDKWLVSIYNPVSMEKELWIYLEGVEWIRDVYLNFDTPYYEAEIDFVLHQIERLQNELNDYANPITIRSGMSVDELSSYFNRSTKTIYRHLQILKKSSPEYFISYKPPIITKDGIIYLEKEFFKHKYMDDLYQYKRKLQRKKLKNYAKEKSS